MASDGLAECRFELSRLTVMMRKEQVRATTMKINSGA